jgi:hypothetical protein
MKNGSSEGVSQGRLLVSMHVLWWSLRELRMVGGHAGRRGPLFSDAPLPQSLSRATGAGDLAMFTLREPLFTMLLSRPSSLTTASIPSRTELRFQNVWSSSTRTFDRQKSACQPTFVYATSFTTRPRPFCDACPYGTHISCKFSSIVKSPRLAPSWN